MIEHNINHCFKGLYLLNIILTWKLGMANTYPCLAWLFPPLTPTPGPRAHKGGGINMPLALCFYFDYAFCTIFNLGIIFQCGYIQDSIIEYNYIFSWGQIFRCWIYYLIYWIYLLSSHQYMTFEKLGWWVIGKPLLSNWRKYYRAKDIFWITSDGCQLVKSSKCEVDLGWKKVDVFHLSKDSETAPYLRP